MVRGADSTSMAGPASRGSAATGASAGGAAVPSRRSNSASVMLGRVSPVRLSGPGIPPRRIVLLILIGPWSSVV